MAIPFIMIVFKEKLIQEIEVAERSAFHNNLWFECTAFFFVYFDLVHAAAATFLSVSNCIGACRFVSQDKVVAFCAHFTCAITLGC